MVKERVKGVSVKRHIQSQKYAWKGLIKIFDHEGNFRIELIAAIFSVTISYLLEINAFEFGVIFLCIGFVLVMETVNGVIELVCDLITKEYNKDIEYAKDAMAGAVLMSAIVSVTVGFLIWSPYIIEIIANSK